MQNISRNKWLILIIVVLSFALVFIIAVKLLPLLHSYEPKVIVKATLMDAVDRSELSTAQFTYNGIATVEKDEKTLCYVRYHATIKAGIDMKDIDFEIDNSGKSIRPILPEITITSNVVDEKELSIIPEGAALELNEAIKACREDAKNESEKSSELIDSATESLRDNVEGLLIPIAASYGFQITWE